MVGSSEQTGVEEIIIVVVALVRWSGWTQGRGNRIHGLCFSNGGGRIMRTRFLAIGGRAALAPFCRQTIPLFLRLSFLNLCLRMKQNDTKDGVSSFRNQLLLIGNALLDIAPLCAERFQSGWI